MEFSVSLAIALIILMIGRTFRKNPPNGAPLAGDFENRHWNNKWNG
jgi:hypothetical protein